MPKRKASENAGDVVSLRLNQQLQARADALVAWLADADEGATLAGPATRSDVLRLAVHEGLRVLEKRAR